LALPAIRAALDVEVIGVIEPGARVAVESTSDEGVIGVIATEATVQSGAYTKAIKQSAPAATVVETACPLFVSLAEEGWSETPEARSIADNYLRTIRERSVSALVLGCTHYPILRKVIQDAVGSEVVLIDSGEAAAGDVAAYLATARLENTVNEPGAVSRQLCDDLDHFYVTDAAARFSRVAERFLGIAPSVLEAVEIWGQDELRAT
jgi:glutamate racemase